MKNEAIRSFLLIYGHTAISDGTLLAFMKNSKITCSNVCLNETQFVGFKK